jgi:hypothetical protein
MGKLREWFTPPPVQAARTVVPLSSTPGYVLNARAGTIGPAYGSGAVSRHEALGVPALNNGVRLLTNITGQLPLTADSDLGVSDDTRTFLRTLDPTVPAGWTTAKTVESLIFHGAAYWVVVSRYATGFPARVEYVDHELVGETRLPDGTTQYQVEGFIVDPADVVKFQGVLPGILTTGALSIRTALANINAARAYAENPIPHMTLTDPEGAEPLEADDARDYLQALTDAVRSKGIAYVAGLEIEKHGWSARELQLVEARDQDAVAMAQLLGLPLYAVSAPSKGSSLTYSNMADNRRDSINALAAWTTTIEGRLSLPDVTPRGTLVRFDAASWSQQVNPESPVPPPPVPVPAPPMETTP